MVGLAKIFRNVFWTHQRSPHKLQGNEFSTMCCPVTFSTVVLTTSMVINSGTKAKKKYMCVYCHMSKKSRVGRSGLIFFLLSTKPKIVVPGSGIRFRYLIFENSGNMTNYAVFLPSLLSISTKS